MCSWNTCSTVIPSAECQSTACVEQIHAKYHIIPDMHRAHAGGPDGAWLPQQLSPFSSTHNRPTGVPSYILPRPNCIHYEPLYPKSLLPFNPPVSLIALLSLSLSLFISLSLTLTTYLFLTAFLADERPFCCR